MSWIFGIYGNISKPLNKFVNRFNPLINYQSDKIKIFAGGLNENLFSKKFTPDVGWLVSGIGIIMKNGNYKIADEENWDEITNNQKLWDQTNGHFIAIKWNKDELTFFNDALGMRDMYFLQCNDFFSFSTRLDFFLYLTNKFELDLKTLSSYWLLKTPLSHTSLFKNVLRLGPAGFASFSNNNIQKVNKYFTPSSFETNNSKFFNSLQGLTTFPLVVNKDLALGLTGGLDSRVLLEVLLRQKEKKFITYTFGNKNLPDLQIAREISEDKNVKHIFIDREEKYIQNQIDNLREYSAQLGLIVPIARTIFYSFYKKLAKDNFTIIDGANGEIHRREFLNRLLLLNKKTVYKKNSDEFVKIFLRNRADIFNYDIKVIMQNELKDLTSAMFNSMPDVKEFFIEKWLDLIMIRYSLSNISGPSQGILDSFSQAFMPFAQIDLINISFNLKLKERKDGRIFKTILAESGNNLSAYPRIKNNIIFPYQTSTLISRLIFLYKRKTGKVFYDDWEEIFLYKMKEYIYDIINSSEFNSFELYDTKKIKKNIEGFYSGDKSLTNYVNWWLSFDIWRNIFLEKNKF